MCGESASGRCDELRLRLPRKRRSTVAVSGGAVERRVRLCTSVMKIIADICIGSYFCMHGDGGGIDIERLQWCEKETTTRCACGGSRGELHQKTLTSPAAMSNTVFPDVNRNLYPATLSISQHRLLHTIQLARAHDHYTLHHQQVPPTPVLAAPLLTPEPHVPLIFILEKVTGDE